MNKKWWITILIILVVILAIFVYYKITKKAILLSPCAEGTCDTRSDCGYSTECFWYDCVRPAGGGGGEGSEVQICEGECIRVNYPAGSECSFWQDGQRMCGVCGEPPSICGEPYHPCPTGDLLDRLKKFIRGTGSIQPGD
ncbi:MAG: hypothetical protein KJ718_05800 [Nanoarchaeota archaeon]|nr:hypothetical protein [Nanoarchaeota archaeon]MBU1052036.1 hypothetical protein [Nanoarchaeota archaeon]MBU1987877.1 hypothetical protein [Nanoarchaeota archaeon]